MNLSFVRVKSVMRLICIAVCASLIFVLLPPPIEASAKSYPNISQRYFSGDITGRKYTYVSESGLDMGDECGSISLTSLPETDKRRKLIDKTGFQKLGSKTYFNYNGKILTGTYEIDTNSSKIGASYRFDQNGALLVGWTTVNFNGCKIQNGYGDKKTGKLIRSGVHKIGKKTYLFAGSRVTGGFLLLNGKAQYFNPLTGELIKSYPKNADPYKFTGKERTALTNKVLNSAISLTKKYAGKGKKAQAKYINMLLSYYYQIVYVQYSHTQKYYDEAYGYLVIGIGSCAGAVNTEIVLLKKIGIKTFVHLNKEKYNHQALQAKIGGKWYTMDPEGSKFVKGKLSVKKLYG